MKILTFIFGLVIGLVAAYGVIEADVIDLPFLEDEDKIVAEEPVEVEEEEEEESLIVRGYSFDPEATGISFGDTSFSFSDEFVTMVEETGRFIINASLPYHIDTPETVYVGVASIDQEIGNETTIYTYNLETNDYSEKFNYNSSEHVARPFAVDGNKLVIEKSPSGDYSPAICSNPWTIFDKEYFELDKEETVAQAYELSERLQAEVDLAVSECEYVLDLTEFNSQF